MPTHIMPAGRVKKQGPEMCHAVRWFCHQNTIRITPISGLIGKQFPYVVKIAFTIVFFSCMVDPCTNGMKTTFTGIPALCPSIHSMLSVNSNDIHNDADMQLESFPMVGCKRLSFWQYVKTYLKDNLVCPHALLIWPFLRNLHLRNASILCHLRQCSSTNRMEYCL